MSIEDILNFPLVYTIVFKIFSNGFCTLKDLCTAGITVDKFRCDEIMAVIW
jgi:hypothetical protein